MTSASNDILSWGTLQTPSGPAVRFAREAMNTTFEIIVASGDTDYSQKAAHEAFEVLDAIECDLSRFTEDSDITRFNGASAGEAVVLGEAAWDCLVLAACVHAETGGAFDPCVGSAGTMDDIEFDEDAFTVAPTVEGLTVDLGGIGKGYALDRMADMLDEWETDPAMMHGGCSTVQILGVPVGWDGWPITLGAGAGDVFLSDHALSGSAQGTGDGHIIDPRSGNTPIGRHGAWALAPTAAEADALSTAFMVMAVDEVSACCDRCKYGAIIAPDTSDVLRFGVTG